jgi:hypothetical protein
VIADIITLYRSRGLRRLELSAALLRHSRIIAGCDQRDAAELVERAEAMPHSNPKRGSKRRPKAQKRAKPLEHIDPERAWWIEYDRKNRVGEL